MCVHIRLYVYVYVCACVCAENKPFSQCVAVWLFLPKVVPPDSVMSGNSLAVHGLL